MSHDTDTRNAVRAALAPGAGTAADRLAALLPDHILRRDAEVGGPLAALVAVLAEQLDAVDDDLTQLYDDWFIETAADWVVAYLGDLVGYRPTGGYEEALAAGDEAARRLAAWLAPRRDVADTVAARRRKGTLPQLESVAVNGAGWPARADEPGRRLSGSQPVRFYPGDPAAVRQRLATAGRTVDVRNGGALELLGTPFDELAHVTEMPRPSTEFGGSRRSGRYHPAAVMLDVWRLGSYSITKAPAYCIDRARNLYTFSILGNDTPLVTAPQPERSPDQIATAENVPEPIRRRALRDRLTDVYGPGKSLAIWRDNSSQPIPPAAIVVADLSDWRYRPRREQVAVDPLLGRIAFGSRHAPRRGVWVSYHYAFGAELGGGEYPRPLADPPTADEVRIYRVGPGHRYRRITDAYEQWQRDRPAVRRAVIEITDGGAYQEQLEFVLRPGDDLEVRAADGVRPVLRLLDWYSNRPDALQIRGRDRDAAEDDSADDADDYPAGDEIDSPPSSSSSLASSSSQLASSQSQLTSSQSLRRPSKNLAAPRFLLDGLVITGRGLSVTGPLGAVTLRHCTLVPGWSLEPDCSPAHPQEPSLVCENTTACVQIERSIVGSIVVIADEVRTDPLTVRLIGSVLDATGPDRAALSAPDCGLAHVRLTLRDTTVFGEIHTHAVELGENSILTGRLRVARRGEGCLRFCFLPLGSRSPRRFHCEQRARPQFTSTRYGDAGYTQLGPGCPVEIVRGADDGAELGVLHALYQPQRADNLAARILEYVPAGSTAGLTFVS